VSETAKLVEQERKATLRLKAQATTLEAQLKEAQSELQTDQARLVELQQAARVSKAGGGPSAPFDGFLQATAPLVGPTVASSTEKRESAAATLVAVTAAVAASPRISAEDFDVAAAAAATRASGNWHSALSKVSSVLKVAHASHEGQQPWHQAPPPVQQQQQQQQPAPGPVLAPHPSAEPAAARPVHPFADDFSPSAAAAAAPVPPEAGDGPSRCSRTRLSEPPGASSGMASRASEVDRSSLVARRTDSRDRRTYDVRDLASLSGTSLRRITAGAAAVASSGRKSEESTPLTAPSERERERASRSSGCRDSGCRDSGCRDSGCRDSGASSSCYMSSGPDAGTGLGMGLGLGLGMGMGMGMGGVGRPRPVSVASVASDLSAMSISKLLPSPLREKLISPGSQQGGTRAVASMSLTMSDCGLVESDLAPPPIPTPSWPPSPAGRGPSLSSDGGRGGAARFQRSSSSKSMDGRLSEGSTGRLSEGSAGSCRCSGGSAWGSGKACALGEGGGGRTRASSASGDAPPRGPNGRPLLRGSSAGARLTHPSQDLSGLTMLVEMVEEDVWTPQRGGQQASRGVFPILSGRESDESLASPQAPARPFPAQSESVGLYAQPANNGKFACVTKSRENIQEFSLQI